VALLQAGARWRSVELFGLGGRGSRPRWSRRLAALVLAAVVGGCGSNPATPVTPQNRPDDVTLPVGPPLATPGERMSYRLTLKGVELGTFVVAVGDLTTLEDGSPTVVVHAQARSSGVARLVADIDDHFTSWVDTRSGRPRRFEVYEHVSRRSPDRDHVVVDFAARDGNEIPVRYGVNDGPLSTLRQRVTLSEVWDYNAFLLAIRAWEAAPGTTATLEVFRSRYVWRIALTLGRRAAIVTELGQLPTLRFDARAFRLGRDGARQADPPERSFTLWISDDNDRVPLKLDATSDYGRISMDIVDYQPGTGQRLRGAE
jgi:Protein of unknown function (DUF3108)